MNKSRLDKQNKIIKERLCWFNSIEDELDWQHVDQLFVDNKNRELSIARKQWIPLLFKQIDFAMAYCDEMDLNIFPFLVFPLDNKTEEEALSAHKVLPIYLPDYQHQRWIDTPPLIFLSKNLENTIHHGFGNIYPLDELQLQYPNFHCYLSEFNNDGYYHRSILMVPDRNK